MKNILESLEHFDTTLEETNLCPVCKRPMMKWKEKLPNGSERCSPICLVCGHKEMSQRNRKKEKVMADQSLKQNIINHTKNISIIQDNSIWLKTFDNYKVVDEETSLAKQRSLFWAKEVIGKEPIHAVLIGKPGAGKTHLSGAMINYVLTGSNYKMECAIVSYQHLYDQIKLYMSDQKAKMQIQGSLLAAIKKCHFVVIDDLGAELGRMEENNQATDFNVGIITSIAEARVNKATVYTTNLSSKQLTHAYGERVFSRIMNKVDDGHVMKFEQTEDKRRNKI